MARAGTSVEALAAERASPELRRCLGEVVERTTALVRAAEPFSGEIKDLRLALEVAVIQNIARTLTGHPAPARSVERARASWRRRVCGTRRGRHHRRPGAALAQAMTDSVADQIGKRRAARLGQLLLHRHAHPAARRARGDVRDLRVLPRGRRHRRRSRPAAAAGARSCTLARRRRCALCRATAGRGCAGSPSRCVRFGLRREDFLASHRRDGNGRGRRHPRARSRDARSLLRPRRERSRAAVACASSAWGRRRASRLPIISAARCSSPTSCATSTRMPAWAASTCRARRSPTPASPPPIRAAVLAHPALAAACAPIIERARGHFREADAIMARCPRRSVRAPRIMAEAYRLMLDGLIARGLVAPRQRGPHSALAPHLDHSALRIL